MPDDLDLKCMQWGENTRLMLKLPNTSKLDGSDALAALQAAAAAIVAAKIGRDTPVAAALNALRFQDRQLMMLHYLLPKITAVFKAKFAGLSPQAYYATLGTSKEFLLGHMAAAAIDARAPATMQPRGTITMSH